MKGKALLMGLLAATMIASPALAANPHPALQDEECHVDAGFPLASFGEQENPVTGEAMHIGGCTLVEEVSSSGPYDLEVHTLSVGNDEVTPIDDCSIQSDDDNDGRSERILEENDTVPDGASIIAFCDTGTDMDHALTLCDPNVELTDKQLEDFDPNPCREEA